MPKNAYNFEIIREAGAWPEDNILSVSTMHVCSVLPPLARGGGSITFVFTDDAHIQTLNRDWRQKDKPTNVLSFPDGDTDETGRIHLGDVILAYETLLRESHALDIPFNDHLTHLLLHGTLHLLGYDHIEKDDAEAMETLEIKLLSDMGIKNPYQNDNLSLD